VRARSTRSAGRSTRSAGRSSQSTTGRSCSGPAGSSASGPGLILGYLMYRSGLVPRGMAMLGLIGGPLIIVSGTAVLFDVIEPGSAAQFIATIPEFFRSYRLASTSWPKDSSRLRSSPALSEMPEWARVRPRRSTLYSARFVTVRHAQKPSQKPCPVGAGWPRWGWLNPAAGARLLCRYPGRCGPAG
jgi:hypothetical protein